MSIFWSINPPGSTKLALLKHIKTTSSSIAARVYAARRPDTMLKGHLQDIIDLVVAQQGAAISTGCIGNV